MCKRAIIITTIMMMVVVGMFSCTEPITIKPQEGPQLVGVYGSITDDTMYHEISLGRMIGFYETEPQPTISDASIFATDGIDTIYFEECEKKGTYRTTEEVAGTPGHTYFLSVDLPEYEGGGHYYAQTTMHHNTDKIDSLSIKQYAIAGITQENYMGLYPFFQSVNDKNMRYMVKITINDSVAVGDKITSYGIYDLAGFTGLYVNGPVMTMLSGQIPIYGFSTKESPNMVHKGDTIKVDIWSIPPAYSGFISDIASSGGSNPMMGAPSNVRTNVGPDGTAVGYFYAASHRQASIIY